MIVTPTQKLGSQHHRGNIADHEAMLQRVRSTPGVAQAAGSIFATATLLDVHRKRLTSATPRRSSPRRAGPLRGLQAGSGPLPVSSDEVAIDQATAQRSGLQVGQQMIVAGETVARRYTVVGIVKFAGGQSFGGAGAALLTLAEAQRVVGSRAHYEQIDVAARPRRQPERAAERIRAVLPAPSTCARAPSRPSKDTSDLETTSASCAPSCWCSPTSPSSSARSSSSTPSRSPSPSAPASSACCARSAPRAGRSWARWSRKACCSGSAAPCSGCSGASPSRPRSTAVQGVRRRSPRQRHRARDAHDRRVAARGHDRDGARGPAPALRATRVPPLAAMREGVAIPPRPLPTRRVLVARFVIGLVVVFALGAITGRRRRRRARDRMGRLRAPSVGAAAARGRASAAPLSRRPRPRAAIGWLVSWRGITARLARENSVRQPGRTMVTAARADRRHRAGGLRRGARRWHQGDDRPAPSAARSPAT